MGVINNYFQLLFNYFSDQLSYEIQLPLEDNYRYLKCCSMVLGLCKCIYHLLYSIYEQLNATWNKCEMELAMLV